MREDQPRTSWYPPDVNPVRKGLYERDHTKSRYGAGSYPIRFSYWNGKHWGGWSIYPWGAFGNRKNASWEQNIPWRGLNRRSASTRALKNSSTKE